MYFIGVYECSAGGSGEPSVHQLVRWLQHLDGVLHVWGQHLHGLHYHLLVVMIHFHEYGAVLYDSTGTSIHTVALKSVHLQSIPVPVNI